jgi:hypothetical protein
MVLVAFVEKK